MQAMKRMIGALILGLLLGYGLSKERPLPKSELHFNRLAYDLVYDGQHKQARYVYEHLTPERIQGTIDRNKFHFEEDPLVPAPLRSQIQDYIGSGYDRGHLCPAADCRSNEEEMRESFFLSNISPQVPAFNRGFWLKLERHVRDLTRLYGELHVYSGGLYLPREEDDGKKYVKYQVIGTNDVSVPTHFFKVIFSGDYSLLDAFILPNEEIPLDKPLEVFQTTLDKVERAAGIIFNPESTEQ